MSFSPPSPRGLTIPYWPQPSLLVSQPFFFIVVFQIFFLGSLFFLVAALSRKIFIVYLQGAAIFMFYLIGVKCLRHHARSLEHFWSGILDPVGCLYSDAIARYWTVVERNS